jgi:hypothetical protein
MKLLILVLAWGSGCLARCDFLRRPLVDGSQGAFRPNSRRFGFFGSLLLRMSIALAGFYLCPAVIGSGCWRVSWICHGTPYRDAAHPDRRSKANSLARRPAMRLSPDEIIFWQYGFFKLNATIVFTWGLMLVLAVGSKLITRRLSTA